MLARESEAELVEGLPGALRLSREVAIRPVQFRWREALPGEVCSAVTTLTL